MKCRSVRALKKLKNKDVINDIKADLSPSTVWFEDESRESWWTCNSPIESHKNEKDLEIVQVWDCVTENDLKELIGIIYINKMHLLFNNLLHKNSMCLPWSSYEMGDILESFPESMWVRTKYAKKSRVDLWG